MFLSFLFNWFYVFLFNIGTCSSTTKIMLTVSHCCLFLSFFLDEAVVKLHFFNNPLAASGVSNTTPVYVYRNYYIKPCRTYQIRKRRFGARKTYKMFPGISFVNLLKQSKILTFQLGRSAYVT